MCRHPFVWFVLGLGWAFGRHRRDNRMHSREESVVGVEAVGLNRQRSHGNTLGPVFADVTQDGHQKYDLATPPIGGGRTAVASVTLFRCL